MTALAINPINSDMYFTAIVGSNNALYRVDGPTGVATFIGTNGSTASTQWNDLAFLPNGALLAANFDGNVYQMSLGNGGVGGLPAYSFFGQGEARGLAFASIPEAVPEPSSLLLALVGAAGTALAVRRRKRALAQQTNHAAVNAPMS
jgi:hypothetical protein